MEVAFGYSPDKLLYSGTVCIFATYTLGINASVDPDSRIALVGNNGVGKSTLLKLMMGELEPVSGQVQIP